MQKVGAWMPSGKWTLLGRTYMGMCVVDILNVSRKGAAAMQQFQVYIYRSLRR